MTKQAIRAKLALMVNLCDEAWKIGDELCRTLAPNGEDDIYELMTEIQERSRTDVDEIMNILEENKYFEEANIEGGEKLDPINVKIRDWYDIELSYPLKTGALVSYISAGDPEALGGGIVYRDMSGVLVDLAYIEQKKGEIAELTGLSKDNEDLDLYLYENPYSEEYTYKNRIMMDDIEKALESD